MVVRLADDHLGGLACCPNGREEIFSLALKFRALPGAAGENERRVQAVEMALRAELLHHRIGERDVGRAFRSPHRLELIHAAEQAPAIAEILRQTFPAPARAE